MRQAQYTQKVCYDQGTRSREYQTGDQVPVLLTSSTHKLLAHWQGPYTIVRKLGKLTFQVDMHDKRKRRRVFHVNLLKKWNSQLATACLAEELDGVMDDVKSEEEILSWT